MKYAPRASALILAGFLAMVSTCVRAGGPGGGHGGSGGHGSGGHAGHSSGGSSSGHSSGHSIGHSIGHSFGYIFGRHGPGGSPAAQTGAPPEHGKVPPSPESAPRVVDRQPRNRFVFRPSIGFSRRRAFGFGGCPYGWFEYNFRFDDNWNCPSDGFFFDPFFSGRFSGPSLYVPPSNQVVPPNAGPAANSAVESPGEPNQAYPPTNSDATKETKNSSGSLMPSAIDRKGERPITLLQLRDGSMYGLTDYWVKDGELHYTTTYGSQNSLPFERIDFEKTVQLNADCGVPFVLPLLSVPR